MNNITIANAGSDLHTQEGALKYVCEKKWGYINDLRGTIGDEMFRKFKTIGYIECGVTREQGSEKPEYKGTWGITSTAEEDVILYSVPEISCMKRLRYSLFGF
ncbi:MAG: hypothetical protein LBS88_00960 [Tannerellaceae bacterium]|jgi:hypothetical protein|nr:hypothetical protein [Tannerellaceae bacterium]